ncbi:gamma-glutamyltransferase family protein [Acetobacter musti]|uniref:Gamma-glutamyltransferase family protein n=1 Tax=Acetobacter musti TaxID=864732 RepID=A0ABX0JVW0_9PROT|nr:gamma-glutamyltransferase family protein [Acetobacter musti]NHN85629.1 gamma-glutamyltransferase family protein [Acetobacter musti]
MIPFLTRPELKGSFGAVATTHWLASSVGQAVLERGGNAFDAAVAAGFTLWLAEPHLNGPAGDAPIIISHAKTGKQHVICGQGVSPAAASIAAFRALGLDHIPGTGHLAAVVPGAFGAWCLMLREFGTWDFADVIDYAIFYAVEGVPVMPQMVATIASVETLFREYWPENARTFMPNGKVPAAGSLLRRPVLEQTLRRLKAAATGATREDRIDAVRNAWYKGFVAVAIDRFCRIPMMDSSGKPHAGFLNAADLAAWSATLEEPVSLRDGRHTVLKCGPWSQGPVFLQQLALLQGFDLSAMPPCGADFVHTVTECAKLAYADREAFYGDTPDVPLATLLSAAYNDARRALVTDRASLDLRPGHPDGRIPEAGFTPATGAGSEAASGVGEPTVSNMGTTTGDTCHIDIVDSAGNMVSATPSGGWLQSAPVIPELGFCLGSRAQMFSVRPDHPNALAPRKRPRTTLTPSFALRDGKPWMAFGTPGGDQQDQWSVIFYLRMTRHGMNIQEAIDAPSFHCEHWPGSFWPHTARPGRIVVEGRFSPDVVDDLRNRGHDVVVGGDWSEGRLSAVRREEGGRLYAGANPRGMQGYAVAR